MSIPSFIKIKNNKLPDEPGVYFYFDKQDKLLYVGKATSLQRRVGSYFTKAHDNRIAEMVSKIMRIDYEQTPTVIEALVLEANQIKQLRPYYNILEQDDKSFLYLVITNELYPKPKFLRGHELEHLGVNPFQKQLSEKAKKHFLAVFGPYTNSRSLKTALELIRKSIPWSICEPPEITGKTKQCFYVHLKKCPGVCAGLIERQAYRKIIRDLILFFQGKKNKILKEFKQEMLRAAKQEKFEEAAEYREKIFALEHIADIALITKDESVWKTKHKTDGIDLFGRIEGYDISNISGTSSVGSMVVFENRKPAKALYRKFKIKTVKGPNDIAMLEEVLRRRLRHVGNGFKPFPTIFVIDGGEGQVHRALEVLKEFDLNIPVIGIAKGADRKQDRFVYDVRNGLKPFFIESTLKQNKELFLQIRDEAHRFAVRYHRKLREKGVRRAKIGDRQ
ncbi:hypothetical protein CO172_03395 [Candidatus Uhrbacteria bacterium CG_4_9_14_3_um_filter_36_7]|uniref:Excinuclease ABC subunit C n=1 Tax=Candidatus Uhrbacteria bacterium CG_4_9_14_3_um_filter_36_7 TaxID=1975033 RepID=A0A2M7XGJ0_9BACT|nr:MAG: hypothetical protein CO172_03395 [Candidatus Uhrbacteria bacterium CG_4_9_14_3_um_filter_36_7]